MFGTPNVTPFLRGAPLTPCKASRSVGRSSRYVGHNCHARWAIPRDAPPTAYSLALTSRRPSGDTTPARTVHRG